jgi:hypothetical protein
MTTQIEATFTNGVLKPDKPLHLADQARVLLTVEPLENPSRPGSAWDAFRAWVRENPLDFGGVRYSRDELHERH